MEYHYMAKIKINKDKSIGSVIYIVEGEKTEPELIKHIFSNMFDYKVVTSNKAGIKQLESKSNKYSCVYIVTAQYPQIKKIEESDDFFNSIYNQLSKQYGLDVENNAIYYIFDRDRDSNNSDTILKNFKKYRNSRDNDQEMNGLFLISYPCIEAFMCNCHNDQTKLSCGNEAKKHTKKYKIENLIEENLHFATKEFIDKYMKIINKEFDISKLDDFADSNKKIFKYEENEYVNSKAYDVLSLLIISLIIEIENDCD